MAARTIVVLALVALPLAASAQSFRCVGKDGKKYYGSTIPAQCVGQPIEQLNAQGTVIRRIDPEGDEKVRAAREAEAAKKREEDALAKEQSRRNRALLATYTSEKDIDEARKRALSDNDKAIQEVERRIADIRKRQAGYEKEMEFYKDGRPAADKGKPRPAGAAAPAVAQPPAKLLEDIKTAEVDLKLQQDALEARKKQVEVINAKYDEDKKRYLELTRRK